MKNIHICISWLFAMFLGSLTYRAIIFESETGEITGIVKVMLALGCMYFILETIKAVRSK